MRTETPAKMPKGRERVRLRAEMAVSRVFTPNRIAYSQRRPSRGPAPSATGREMRIDSIGGEVGKGTNRAVRREDCEPMSLHKILTGHDVGESVVASCRPPSRAEEDNQRGRHHGQDRKNVLALVLHASLWLSSDPAGAP